jgi:hypothetical protein
MRPNDISGILGIFVAKEIGYNIEWILGFWRRRRPSLRNIVLIGPHHSDA